MIVRLSRFGSDTLPRRHPQRYRDIVRRRTRAGSIDLRSDEGCPCCCGRDLGRSRIDKDRILTTTVFIADMAQKDEMNRAWDEWADRDNAPMRVCVSAGLTGACLVEMLVTAAAS